MEIDTHVIIAQNKRNAENVRIENQHTIESNQSAWELNMAIGHIVESFERKTWKTTPQPE